MRFMLTFRLPMEEGNALVKDGCIGPTLETILDDLKPEAAYFSEIEEGARGGYLVVNVYDASHMPAVFEPLFLGLGATAQISPVFTPEMATLTGKRCSKWHRSTAGARYYTRSRSR